MSAYEGMMGSVSISGTALALMAGIDISWTRKLTEWVSMGETATSDVLVGVKQVKGSIKKAFTSWAYRNIWNAGTVLVGTIYPLGLNGTATYIAGTMVFSDGKLSGMQQGSEAAIMEDMNFIMYNVTTAP